MYILPCGAIASEWFGLLTITLKVNVNKWASPIVHCKYNNWFTLSLINLEYSNCPNHFVCGNYYHISYPDLCGGTYTSCGIHYGWDLFIVISS